MNRRPPPDPQLLQTVSRRLARLLEEAGHPPRPGSAGEPAEPLVEVGRLGADGPGVGADADGLEVLEPTPPRTFRRAHLVVLAMLLLAGVAWAGWGVLRARPVAVPAVEVSAPAATPAPPTPADPRSAGTATAAPGLVVHVLGAVREPGLVRLPAGARVADALEAAGGLTARADPAQLNLAQPLSDGQQVVVGSTREPLGEVRDGTGSGGTGGTGTGSSGTGTGTSGDAGSGAVVNLNSADAAALDALPGVGPVTAAKIVAWREEHGRFSRIEELQEVDGIGPKTFAEIAPHVQV